ncbi:MAG: hypothetical protein IPJ00_00155 [Saprospirales bacterium]|nr:hypothetical protein [Saprospirales bacterium]
MPERTDALIDQYKPGYKDPVTQPADSEPADPEPLGVEEPGLPPAIPFIRPMAERSPYTRKTNPT